MISLVFFICGYFFNFLNKHVEMYNEASSLLLYLKSRRKKLGRGLL